MPLVLVPREGALSFLLQTYWELSEWYFSGEKCLVDFRGHLRMARLLRGKGTITQITTCDMVAGCQTTRVYKSTGSLKGKRRAEKCCLV